MSELTAKTQRLLALAHKRQTSIPHGYLGIGDKRFNDGKFECNHVSPWGIIGHKEDATVMVVGKDWSSEKTLKQPTSSEIVKLGYNPGFDTNTNLNELLKRHFGLTHSDCYMTNLFPFVKKGNASGGIKSDDLVKCAHEYTIPEIQIVEPRLVVCLGQEPFFALRKACDLPHKMTMGDAIALPFRIGSSMVHCVPHPGYWGPKNRGGMDNVDQDWHRMAKSI